MVALELFVLLRMSFLFRPRINSFLIIDIDNTLNSMQGISFNTTEYIQILICFKLVLIASSLYPTKLKVDEEFIEEEEVVVCIV